MRKYVLLAVLACVTALSVNAQTKDAESKADRYFRMSKVADENPSDWKAQLEVGHILLDKEGGFYNQSRAARYYERIYHIASDVNREIPDSVIRETNWVLMTLAVGKGDIERALFYIDEMKHANSVGVGIEDSYLNLSDMYGLTCCMGKEDYIKALSYLKDLRDRVTQRHLPGIEHTDLTTAMLLEEVFELEKAVFGDKLMELTIDGKKYIVVSMGEWDIEKPFIGWSATKEGSLTLFYGEDGKVYDNLHGEMNYSFFCNKDGIVPHEESNARLITVTPEHRQQMVKAYRNYMEKRTTK
jgi:hypothetical protein